MTPTALRRLRENVRTALSWNRYYRRSRTSAMRRFADVTFLRLAWENARDLDSLQARNYVRKAAKRCGYSLREEGA